MVIPKTVVVLLLVFQWHTGEVKTHSMTAPSYSVCLKNEDEVLLDYIKTYGLENADDKNSYCLNLDDMKKRDKY